MRPKGRPRTDTDFCLHGHNLNEVGFYIEKNREKYTFKRCKACAKESGTRSHHKRMAKKREQAEAMALVKKVEPVLFLPVGYQYVH